MRVLVVTGQSGAGKSTALRALEDGGYVCVDNLPVIMLDRLVAYYQSENPPRVAVGVDARTPEGLQQLPEQVAALRASGCNVDVVFVESDEDALVRRYSETRRSHPMGELPEAIAEERAALRVVRALADGPIDTTRLSGRELRQVMLDRYAVAGALAITLVSFGFRNGVPSQADWVMDCRMLKNPFDDRALRPLSGLHEPVARYVLEQADAQALLSHAEALLRLAASRGMQEGRSYLTFALGCTGGQHRSVAMVEALRARIDAGPALCEPPPRWTVRHRDVGGRS